MEYILRILTHCVPLYTLMQHVLSFDKRHVKLKWDNEQLPLSFVDNKLFERK